MFGEFVRQSSAAPGAATTINLVAPATGFRSFATAFPGAMTCGYFIRDPATNQWERGTGVATSGSPDTLMRTTVLSNSFGTTARVNFTGNVEVYNQLFPPSAVGAALMLAANDGAARDAILARATLGTSVATTSGSAVAWTALPAGINWIELHFSGVSTNSVDVPFVRLGTGAGPTYATTGYAASVSVQVHNVALSAISSAVAFLLARQWAATNVISGTLRFSRMTGDRWNCQGALSLDAADGTINVAGSVNLPGPITAIQIATAGAFDAGTANASWGF